jgi:flagellar motor switch protein FliG
MLEDEMKAMGPVKSKDVKAAQSALVEAAVQLAESGEVELPEDDSEEMME